jgi:hypothetical protein
MINFLSIHVAQGISSERNTDHDDRRTAKNLSKHGEAMRSPGPAHLCESIRQAKARVVLTCQQCMSSARRCLSTSDDFSSWHRIAAEWIAGEESIGPSQLHFGA